jgi:hypothetical protein
MSETLLIIVLLGEGDVLNRTDESSERESAKAIFAPALDVAGLSVEREVAFNLHFMRLISLSPEGANPSSFFNEYVVGICHTEIIK